jgi:hypothetical protein
MGSLKLMFKKDPASGQVTESKKPGILMFWKVFLDSCPFALPFLKVAPLKGLSSKLPFLENLP